MECCAFIWGWRWNLDGGRPPQPSADLFLWAFVKAIWLPSAYPTVLMAAILGSFQLQALSVHAVPLSLFTAVSKA